LIDLEKILENPNDPARVRFLDGADESPEEIMKKLEQVINSSQNILSNKKSF
jgi:hypothetical protein